MLLNVILALLSLALLVWSASKMVEGSASVAARLHISDMVIGLTIVAFGTSAPELIISAISSYQGQSALAMGNVMGSNIFNVLAILGITSMITMMPVQRQTTLFEVPLLIVGAALAVLFYYSGDNGAFVINRVEALLLFLTFVVFVVYIILSSRSQASGIGEDATLQMPMWKSALWIVLGLAGLVFAGQVFVDKAVAIAHGLGVSEHVIAVTIVSIGTSLPELVTSIVAACKKNTDMAVGNIIGSNIFNSFAILGVAGLISPMELGADVELDLKVNILAVSLLYLFIFTGKGRNIERWEGMLFFAIFIGYIYTIL